MAQSWWDYVERVGEGLAQKDIAKRTGIEATSFTRWKQGKNHPRAEQVVQFARAFHRPPTEALVAADYITEAEAAQTIEVYRGLEAITDDELLAEVQRRLASANPEPNHGEAEDWDPSSLDDQYFSIISRMPDVQNVAERVEADFSESGHPGRRARIPQHFFNRYLHHAAIDALFDRINPQGRNLPVHRFDLEEWHGWIGRLRETVAEYDHSNSRLAARFVEVVDDCTLDQLDSACEYLETGIRADEILIAAADGLVGRWRADDSIDENALVPEAHGFVYGRRCSIVMQQGALQTINMVRAERKRSMDAFNARSSEYQETDSLLGTEGTNDVVVQSLLDHYSEMLKRAQAGATRTALVEQARIWLDENVDYYKPLEIEVDDAAYVQYLAARHSTAHQGGHPDLHSKVSLSKTEYSGAEKRYRREFSEMVLFDGQLRAIGSPPRWMIEQYQGAPAGDKSLDKPQEGDDLAALDEHSARLARSIDDTTHREKKRG